MEPDVLLNALLELKADLHKLSASHERHVTNDHAHMDAKLDKVVSVLEGEPLVAPISGEVVGHAEGLMDTVRANHAMIKAVPDLVGTQIAESIRKTAKDAVDSINERRELRLKWWQYVAVPIAVATIAAIGGFIGKAAGG